VLNDLLRTDLWPEPTSYLRMLCRVRRLELVDSIANKMTAERSSDRALIPARVLECIRAVVDVVGLETRQSLEVTVKEGRLAPCALHAE
jgi:hypothetical protein